MAKIRPKNYIQMPPGALLQLLPPLGGGSVAVCPICSVCVDFVVLFCNAVLSIFSSFAVIWMRKRDLALYLYCVLAVL